MAAITTRAGKGLPLTHAEVDANFNNLNTELGGKVESSLLSELIDDRVAALLVAGSNVTLTYNDVANTLTVAASSGGITDGDKGDITVSIGGTVWTIDPAAVTYSKFQNVSAPGRVLGRFTTGAGSVEEITLAGLLEIVSGALTARGFTHYVPSMVTTGSYLYGNIVAIAQSTIATVANRLEYYPYCPSRDVTIDELALEVTTAVAATNARLGVYDSTSGGIPGNLLTGAGTLLDCSTAGVKTSAVLPTVTLKAGIQYWLAVLSSGTQTYRGIPLAGLTPLPVASGTPNTCYRQTQTFASGLPSTASGLTFSSNIGVWIRMRVA